MRAVTRSHTIFSLWGDLPDVERRVRSGAFLRQLRRLFQQYLGGGAWGSSAPLVDRFVSPSASRVIDYVAVMTVKMAPQLMEESDKLSNVKQVRRQLLLLVVSES